MNSEEKEFPNEYTNLKREEVAEDLEAITNKEVKQENTHHVRTFAKDVAEQMKSNSASVVKIALAEQGRQREYETIVKKSKKQQILYLALTFVFVVGGSMLLGLAFQNRNNEVPLQTPISQEKTNALIFSEYQEVLNASNLSRSEFIETFRQRVSFIKSKNITNVIAVFQDESNARAMHGEEFVRLVGTNVPEELPPILNQDFMIGVDGDNSFSVFAILSFTNFDSTVSLMRGWEPFFVQDMIRLLNIQTGGQGIEIFSKSFNSEIIFNKESRVLRDQNQGLVVGYTFLDRNTLVVYTNLETLEEVLNRYTIQEIQ